jgi:hypothetical protein
MEIGSAMASRSVWRREAAVLAGVPVIDFFTLLPPQSI